MTHPSLIVICDWPAEAKDITPELSRTLCNGNVKAALESVARLLLTPHIVPPPTTTGHDDDGTAASAGTARGKVA